MLVVAVTGGIGSGKSTVVELFKSHQIPVIDTDLIARSLVEPGQAALAEIISTFGTQYLDTDGSLNRSALREHVFMDEKERLKLESILHPRIHQVVLDQLKEIDAPYCLLVIPLLAETKQHYPCDRVLVVDVTRKTQLARTMQRDNLDEKRVSAIIDSQASREQRLALATDVIDNNADKNSLRQQVEALHEKYLDLASSKA